MPKTQARSATSRVWWLVRGIDAFRSFVFPIQVTVEEDEPNLYGASIHGLEDHVAAMGQTADEAERNALELFQGIVDDALDAGTSVAYAIGDMRYMTAAFPVAKAAEFLFRRSAWERFRLGDRGCEPIRPRIHQDDCKWGTSE